MRWMLLLCVLLLGGTVSAQVNNPPEVKVIGDGGDEILNSGSIEVKPYSSFNSAAISYEVDDPDGDAVGCNVLNVTNESEATNWSPSHFAMPSTPTPFVHDVQASTGEFGADGVIHIVTLEFDDGTDQVIFSFTIVVTTGDPDDDENMGTPGSPGGSACSVGTPAAPWAVVTIVGILLAIRSRRRKTISG